MKNVKKNNKGFSLVELIVVVMIMAIIAAALAPQVMKWVNNSRIATDVSNYDSLVANCQLALTDSDAYKESKAATDAKRLTITISSTGTSFIDSNDHDSIDEQLDSLDPSWTTLKPQVSGNTYKIEIYDGTVHKTTAPSDTME